MAPSPESAITDRQMPAAVILLLLPKGQTMLLTDDPGHVVGY